VGRKEQAEASRTELLAAARACFTERGYDDTTVAAILDRAGMARGALYHYFPGGKADVFTAVFELVDSEYHARRDAMLALPSPIERLRGGVGVFLELCADESFARIALADAPRVVPGQNELGSSYSLLREQLADAMRAGELRALDIAATSRALYGAVRSSGEFVLSSPDPRAAVGIATRTVHAIIDGLRSDAQFR